MAEWKKRDLIEPDPILDEEDEGTLAAIDRGIKAVNEGRVVSFEEARRGHRGLQDPLLRRRAPRLLAANAIR